MHLHGFYFEVDNLGDGMRDTAVAPTQKRRVVTHLMQPGATLAMTWRPERVGNWLFHCHISEHVSPARRLGTAATAHQNHHAAHDAAAGMAGMILGVTVVGSEGGSAEETRQTAAAPARTLTLRMQTEPNRYGDKPAYGFALLDGEGAQPVDKVTVPGPTLVLERGQPVEIALVNALPEATSIHWHGIELESFYDGVHGWSGERGHVTPLIEAGQTFTVRFTPPRAGTFMYHTHMHDERQLTSGLYGALIVAEPGTRFDPEIDHVLVLGRGGPGRAAPAVVNGVRDPQLTLKAGVPHRVRLINITPDDILAVSLATRARPLTWQELAKDGAPVPAADRASKPATQIIAVGETYDFEYTPPPGRHALWLEVRTPAGRWQVQGRITVK